VLSGKVETAVPPEGPEDPAIVQVFRILTPLTEDSKPKLYELARHAGTADRCRQWIESGEWTAAASRSPGYFL
jgi:hypothetical protein